MASIYPVAVFLKLGSAKGCQGFRETKTRNGGRVLFAVLNFYVRNKISVAALDTDHSVADRAASVQKLPDSVVKSVSKVRLRVDVSGETIGLSTSFRLAVDFYV